jgi:hypothetical protein
LPYRTRACRTFAPPFGRGSTMSAKWWKPASDLGLVEWQKGWGVILKKQPAGGINSSGFYVNRAKEARDLQSRLLAEVSDAVNKSAAACSHSSEIADEATIAREALDPLNRKAKEAIAAQPGNAEARGLTQAMVPTEKDLKLADEEYLACRAGLETSLRQRRAQLATAEKDAEEGRTERAIDRAARAKKDRIDFWARVVQIGAAAFAAFGFKGAAIASVLVGIGALFFHEHKGDPGF